MVALRTHDFCGAGETDILLEPRHPPLGSVAPGRGSLDSTLWNDGVNAGLADGWNPFPIPLCQIEAVQRGDGIEEEPGAARPPAALNFV